MMELRVRGGRLVECGRRTGRLLVDTRYFAGVPWIMPEPSAGNDAAIYADVFTGKRS
jgi:hypothetical protein